MIPIEFDFCFKGERTYVHGTDIYDQVLEELTVKRSMAVETIDVSINKISTQNLKGYLVNENEGLNGEYKAQMKFFSDGESKILYLEEQNEEIECREAYDEKSIVSKSKIDLDTESISMEASLPFSSIEKTVALNKHLLQKIFSEKVGKWYFTRLKLDKPFDNKERVFRIKFRRNFKFKLVQSDIVVDEKQVGTIYFSLV